jgi:glyoxylase-like metal-dependent hydrolase (beta-lactamase superfamily II)
MAMSSAPGRGYVKGLQEVGDGLYAYLQPDGGWGWSNAGLVADGESTLLIDTLFDLKLTGEMLADMRRAVPAAASIETLLNTHANGDHCYGNQLLKGARIVASARTAEEMPELPATAMAALVAQAPEMGELGAFFLHCFGAFDFEGIEMVLPDQTFSGELALKVGSREVRLIEAGPAHTRGDTLALLPAERVLFSGDIIFNGGHPIGWAGPVSNWIAACERILAMDVDLIVPGHGPLADKAVVRELKAYFEYLYEQARACYEEGMDALQAARAITPRGGPHGERRSGWWSTWPTSTVSSPVMRSR